MNPSNYCTLPIAKRLHEAGIEIETDFYHYIPYPCQLPDASELVDKKFKERYRYANDVLFYPAPTLAEVWRELPECKPHAGEAFFLKMFKFLGKTWAGYYSNEKYIIRIESDNPTDAACLLLLWVKGANYD